MLGGGSLIAIPVLRDGRRQTFPPRESAAALRGSIGGWGTGRNRIGVGLRQFLLQLLAQRVQLAFGESQRLDVVAQNAFGSLFHAAFQFVDALAGALLELTCLLCEAALDELGGEI